MKYTAGPWESHVITDYKPKSILETYIKQIVILGPVKDNGWQSHIAEVNLQFGEEISSANAQLLAEGPRLLTACQKALDLLNTYRAAPTPYDAGRVCEILMAAIENATKLPTK